MDLDTVRLGFGWFLFRIWICFGFRWIGSGRFFWIWICLVFSIGLDSLVFLSVLDFGFFRIWIFLVFFWIGLVWFFFGNGSFGFQSGLDLKRYFQKALIVKKKKLTDTGFLIVWFF